ncbi:ICE-like protease (caspase) p20 domain protein [Ceratobasidium sp. AG-Ba]|nr:ICE-like protease (caspase) p20 domain protein [Ceratobasidium sp. AG-Ba]
MSDEIHNIPESQCGPRGKYYDGKPKKAANWKKVQHSEQTSTSDDCGQSSVPTNVTLSTSTSTTNTTTTKRRSSAQFSASSNDKNKKRRKTSAGSVSLAAELQVKSSAEVKTDSYSSGYSSRNTQSTLSSQDGSGLPSQTPQCSQRRNSRSLPRKRSSAKLVGLGDHRPPPMLLSGERVEQPLYSPVMTSEPAYIYSEQDDAREVDEHVEQLEMKSSAKPWTIGSWASTEEYFERDSTHKGKLVSEHEVNPGKRSALVIGIQYKGQVWPVAGTSQQSTHSLELLGSHTDARAICRHLIRQGYLSQEIRMMTDEPHTPPEDVPTYNNLKSAFKKLVSNAQPNDRLFVYFAGHGHQVDDEDGDEDDGKDEAIIPCDWATSYNYSDQGLIIDDLLRTNYIDQLPAGCQLMGVFDSCHSGTILDLPECYPKQKYNSVQASLQCRTEVRNPHKPVAARVICFAACMDPQYSYETRVANQQPRGRFTKAFIQTMKKFVKNKKRNPTALELYRGIAEQLGQPSTNGSQPPNQDPLLTSSVIVSFYVYHYHMLDIYVSH